MSDPAAGPPRLLSVAAGGGAGSAAPAADAAAIDAPASDDGLTPPTRRGGRSRFITDVVVELGYVERTRADAAAEESRRRGMRPGDILLEAGAITPQQLAHSLAERFGLDYVDLGSFEPDVSALSLITHTSARRIDAVPIGFDSDERLIVAMTDPTNVLALDDLKLMTGREIRPAVASGDDVGGLITRMSRLDDAVAAAIGDDEASGDAAPVAEIRESAEEGPVIKLVNSVIAQAIEQRASDLHMEPDGRDMRVRLRIDGVLIEAATIPRRMVAGVISRVKIMGDLDISERRVPQDGRVGLKVDGRAVDIRIVTMPSVHGEGIVMRLLDKEGGLVGLDVLGMASGVRERFERSFHKSHGAVLVTGPTGSGKSTTLYSALNAINTIEKNIITIEDPVEYQLAGVNQLQVNSRAGLTFATGLRSMLRADPDVIMVGEIRDAETARIAVESALTGHLVLSTLHTNDAPSAITRLTEMGIEPFLTASALDTVVAQRLARTLCTHCKRAAILTPEVLSAAGFRADFEIEGYEPVGCPRCKGSGYRGRTGLYEVMAVTEEIRSLAIARSSADEVKAVATEQGMRLLREDGLERVKQGVTSVAEVARVT